MNPESLRAIDSLQRRYIRALDSKDMEGWLACFADVPEASYVCTSLENVENDLPVAHMLDDCRARIEDRVTYVTRIWKGTYQDYRTRHFVERLEAETTGDETFSVESNVSIVYTPEDTGESGTLAAGIYQDRIRVQGGDARFLSKKVILDTRVLPRYLVYPF